MSYYISHAASSESGTLYGNPGDQTGNEVRLNILGQDGNDWVSILRCTDRPTALRIARNAHQCSANNHIGYAQYTAGDKYRQRTGLFDAVGEVGGDFTRITKDVNCDCSAMVAACVYYAGILSVSKNMTTSVEESALLSTKYFQRIPYNINSVQLGDVLLRSGHTGIVCWNDDLIDPEKTVITAKKYYKPTTALNMRDGVGSLTTRIIATISQGAKVEYANEQKKDVLGTMWYKVIYNGKTGWCSSKYLTNA